MFSSVTRETLCFDCFWITLQVEMSWCSSKGYLMSSTKPSIALLNAPRCTCMIGEKEVDQP